MSFSLTPAQQELRERTIDFARSELEQQDDLAKRDREAAFDRSLFKKSAAEGILGSHLPTEYGGQGRGALETVIALEALGYGCRDNGLTLGLGGQIWSVQEPILIYGSEEQKQRYLPRLASGEWIGAHGVSEESTGSDALSLKTTATRVEGGYLLNGRKCYIGMGPECDLALVLANADPEAGKWGVSAFVVEDGTDGFSKGPARPKSGTRTNPMGDLDFEDCFVPEENRIGSEGLGVSLFSRTISWERAFIHAGHLGAMDRLLELCVRYAGEREQFGKPIGAFQAVSHRIAEMKLRQETSRLLLYRVASMKDAGESAELECAMAKLHIAESLLANASDAVRIHGARGYLEEFEIERELRDSLGGVIYAGTSDIQRNIISSILGL